MQEKTKVKQTQWGITLLIGILILIGTVGHLETGGDIFSSIFTGLIGTLIGGWGLVKSAQWGLFEDE